MDPVSLVGGALLSGFFNVVFDRLASKEVLEFLRGKKVVAEHVYELKTRLGSANKLLFDAEEKQIGDQDVKRWLDELRDVVYEADHLLDKINTEALRRKVEESGEFGGKASKLLHFIPGLVSAFENGVKHELMEIVLKLKLLLDQTVHLGLKENNRARVSQERLLSPLVEESDVCGRKVEKEAIVELLLKDDFVGDKIKVIPIVGMGGIGKTTLARLVYNDGKVQEHFDSKAWVIVSENFDVPRITKTILEMVLEHPPSTDDPHKLQSDLKVALRGKKFLFVLDDVWCENYDLWEVLKSSFESGEPGSKIIVTTRSTIVASTVGNAVKYDLQTISEDDCWSLFAKHVGFVNSESAQNSELRSIGIEIVKKCKGLPLAVKSIAGLLRSVFDPDVWRRVLQSDIWELQNTKILPALWLSYQFLPPNLKRCFAFFSMFPKDYEFDQLEREKIVLLWIAEGLLQDEKGKRMEDVGKDYFNALISRSFFQRSSRNISTFLMHDLLHDLAIRISGESSFILDEYSNDNVDSPKINAKTRHLLYWKDSKDRSIEFEDLSEAKCLRTFLAIPLAKNSSISFSSTQTEKALSQLFSSAGARLRVLSLSSSSFAQLPDSFDNLKHLRYLDLSCTQIENVPDSVCLLYNLQTLMVSNCKKLTQLPTNTCNLINLRHLDVQMTPLKEMPPKMDNLKNLHGLSDFVVGKNDVGNKMKELGELKLLRGNLRISGLENVEDFWDFSQANLKSKEFLTKLILTWEGETEDSRKERELLSELRPHPNLKELEINGFRGTTFPNWVGNQSSNDMTQVILSKCKNCVILPPFGQLQSLKELRIQETDQLVSIGDEFCTTSLSVTSSFLSLETLSFDGLLMWKEWSFSRRTMSGKGRFPCLKHLHLELCRRLNIGVPNGVFPSLKSVSIFNCRSMETVFPNSRLPIDESFPSLESIQIRRCPRLELFSRKGLPCNIRNLEIHDDCELLFANRTKWGLERLSRLEKLELSGCKQIIDSFPDEGLLPSNLARLRIDSFRNLKSLNGIGFQCLTSLQQLSICECEQLDNLPEEGLPSSLSYLRIVQCNFLSQRCQRNIGEDWPKIQHIPIIIINREEI